MSRTREQWGSRLGVILAVAGSAIGLGNFIRFPSVAVANGGGAFMIPYFVALILVGIPVAWVEWTLGRWGGKHGLNTGPSIFHLASRKMSWKYLGVLNVIAPLVIMFYYVLIETWCLGYVWYAFSGGFPKGADPAAYPAFFGQFVSGGLDTTVGKSLYLFFGITFLLNYFIISRGISKGIERITLIAMPLLLICAVLMVLRVFTLSPDIPNINGTIGEGLNFLWQPDFSALLKPKVWFAAFGQIFFTLSLGLGALLCYSSYVNENEDVALSSLTASATNTFVEVILGSSIIIPAAIMFFGAAQSQEVAKAGGFGLSFMVLPQIFQTVPLGSFFLGVWFLLLFLAGLTSSISLIQPVIAFLQNEYGLSRLTAVALIGAVNFLMSGFVIVGNSYGVLDEFDFWAANFAALVSAFLLIALFNLGLGTERGLRELNRCGQITVPRLFLPIIRYVSPALISTIFLSWLFTEGKGKLFMEGVPEANQPWILGTRLLLAGLLGGTLLLAHFGRRDYLETPTESSATELP